MMKNSLNSFLTVTALIEVGAGLALLAMPSLAASVLVGAPLETPVSLVVARITGAALLSLGIACWLARDDAGGRTVRGLVAAMLVYNLGAAAVLMHARLGFGLNGMGLWPVVLMHIALSVWGVMCLQGKGASAPLE